MAQDGKIFIGSDHAGFMLKERLKKYMAEKAIPYEDMGNLKLDPGDDYPDYAEKVARKVAETGGRGVLVCDSGVGVCIAANKVRGVRAVNASSERIAMMSRQHNNANVLCLGQDYLSEDESLKVFDTWLNTPFSPEPRHHRRVDKIARIEGS